MIPLHVTGKYVFSLGASFVVAHLLTLILVRFGGRLGFMDHPGGRRTHAAPVPRCGGIAIFIAFHLTCYLVLSVLWRIPLGRTLNAEWWRMLFFVSSALFAIGLIDDRWEISPLLKLLGQVVVALLAYRYGMRFGSLGMFQIPVWVDLIITVLWFLVVINAFNLIDGMDGLAAGLAVIACAGLGVFSLIQRQPFNTLVILALVGAVTGFLRFNFHPARIFMGDSGSMFLGFTIAAIGLSTSTKSVTIAALGVPLMAVGIPLMDTALAVWRRSVRHYISAYAGSTAGKIAQADRDHLHHRLARKGLTQRKVAVTLYAINGVMIVSALAFAFLDSYRLAIILFAFLVFAYVTIRHLATVELWDSAMAIAAGLRRPQRTAVAVLLYPLLDVLALVVSGTLAAGLLAMIDTKLVFKQVWFDQVPISTAVPFLCMAAGGVYRRVWSRARVSEYVLPPAFTFVGMAIALALRPFLGHFVLSHELVNTVLFCAFALPGVTALRVGPRLVQDLLAWFRKRRSDGQGEGVPTLCYGGGYGFTLFVRALSFDVPERKNHWNIVGIIDDDRNLQRRIVHGFLVLGGHETLEKNVVAQGVKEIVLTTALDPAAEAVLRAVAATHGIRVCRWCATVVTDTGCLPVAGGGVNGSPGEDGADAATGREAPLWIGRPVRREHHAGPVKRGQKSGWRQLAWRRPG